MDPTLDFVVYKSSFSKDQPVWSESLLPRRYSPDENVFKKDIIISDVETLKPIHCDETKYNELQTLQDMFGKMLPKEFTEARDNTLPITNLGNSIFMNRASIKIANIDALFNVSDIPNEYKTLQHDGKFYFCDIAAGPGGFSQYVLWRRPESFGYGITLKMEGLEQQLNWNTRRLGNRFKYTYGMDGTGNLYTQWKTYVEFVKSETNRVNLVMGDGGFHTEGNDYRQEFLSSRLLLTQILTAISLLSTGGNFVCKIFDSVTSLSAELIYLCSLCFHHITIIKPLSSRWGNSERYIVAKGFKPESAGPIIDILSEANEKYTNKNVIQVISSKLPKTFTDWLHELNSQSIKLQTKMAIDIIKYTKLNKDQKERYITEPLVNLSKCFILWNIPGNTPNMKN